MSYADLSQPVVINRENGAEIRLERCTPADRIKFRKVLRSYAKAWRAESLRFLNVAGREAVEYLDEIDKRPLRESEVVEWLNEPEGQREAILLSLKHGRAEATIADVDALGLDRHEMLAAAAGVFDVPLVPVKDGQSPLPEGPASGQTETGDAKPPNSPPDSESPSP